MHPFYLNFTIVDLIICLIQKYFAETIAEMILALYCALNLLVIFCVCVVWCYGTFCHALIFMELSIYFVKTEPTVPVSIVTLQNPLMPTQT